jgi:hypothetical protein
MLQVIFEEVVLPWRLARIGELDAAAPGQPALDPSDPLGAS